MRLSQRIPVTWLILFVFGINLLPVHAELPPRAVITADNAHRLELYKVIGNKIPLPPGPHLPISQIGLVFSPNAKMLAFNYPDSDIIQILDIESGKVIAKLSYDPGLIVEAVFSPDSNTLYTLAFEGNIRSWDITTWRSWRLPIHLKHIYSNIALSRDGLLLAVGGSSEYWIFNTQTHELVQHIEWEYNSETVYKLFFKPDKSQLLVVSKSNVLSPDSGSGSVRLYDIQSGNLVASLDGNQQYNFWASLSPEGSWNIVSVYNSNTSSDRSVNKTIIRVWDIARHTSQLLREYERAGGPIIFSPSGKLIGIGESFYICNLSKLTCAQKALNTGYFVKFGLDDSIVLDQEGVLSVTQKERIFTIPTQEDLPHEWVMQTDLSPDGTIIGALFIDGTIQLWTVPTS
jgi:WD40 repeat protein